MIGGNIIALVQVKDKGKRNKIGEVEQTWSDAVSLKGFLDYSGGQNDDSKYHTKVQESTHIFICDFYSINSMSKKWVWDSLNLKNGTITSTDGEKIDVTSQNSRIIIDGLEYQVLLIDDPMNLHQHLEIYLKYLGGGHGVG